jgi:MFS family permease
MHRAADNLGAVLGPLLAWLLLQCGVSVRQVMWWAAVPGALSVVVLALGVRERRAWRASGAVIAGDTVRTTSGVGFGAPFWRYLAVLLLFTLGNSSDAFLLLRATQLGVPVAMIPVLWACLSVVKSASSVPGGTLSDRVGRRPLIVGGWIVYSIVYICLARARLVWQVWALFAVYGVYFGLTEGVEKAMIADLVPAESRGAAYGWYNLTVGLGALPASVLFGVVWERFGASAAFSMGATIGVLATVALLFALSARPARDGAA